MAVLAATMGCSGSHPGPEAARGLTDSELRWVSEYADWSDSFGDQLADEWTARAGVLGASGAPAVYREATTELRDCRSRLDDRLGDAPTPRLERTLNDLRGICDLVAPAVQRLAGADDPDTRTEPFVDVGQAIERASLEWSRVDAALDEISLARSALPRQGGNVSQSRVEPTLSAVAEVVADGRPVEVRCWSPDDWGRVLREEAAFTQGAMTVDIVGAFALPLTGTVHLQQTQCAALSRLIADRWQPAGGADREDLAFAVGTLSHEVQHIVAPTSDEAGTECAAVQHNAEVARELGATPAYARQLAQFYWEELYPEEGSDYRSDGCRDGGALDLAPETPAWPTG